MSTYTLYYMPGAASLVVHWLLLEVGAPYELQKIDGAAGEHKRPEYLRLNPSGVVPTLIVDGEPVCEAAAIALLLAERHPEAHLAPMAGTRARAVYLQWMLHLANTLQPAFRQWFYAAEAAGSEHEEAARRSARGRIEAVFDRLDAHLAEHGPYVCGEQLTAVDFHACMLVRWARNMPKPATEWPRIADFARRMKERPSFREVCAREELTEWL